MAIVRHNQASLSAADWTAFVNAVNAIHSVGSEPPLYQNFVRVHVNAMSPIGMSWRVHTMPGMIGVNFLAWHRQFLAQLEARLRKVDATVSLPYWDWIVDRQIPPALAAPAVVAGWSISRSWDVSLLPTQGQLDAAMDVSSSFAAFQLALEKVHGNVHNAVGGTMETANSPADPLFWLHHANIDRLWSQWQKAHRSMRPANRTEILQPPPLFGTAVSSVLSVSKLGYRYK